MSVHPAVLDDCVVYAEVLSEAGEGQELIRLVWITYEVHVGYAGPAIIPDEPYSLANIPNNDIVDSLLKPHDFSVALLLPRGEINSKGSKARKDSF